jgi:hypothetical protein
MKIISRNPIVRLVLYSTFTGLIGLAVGYSIGYNDPSGRVQRMEFICGSDEPTPPKPMQKIDDKLLDRG